MRASRSMRSDGPAHRLIASDLEAGRVDAESGALCADEAELASVQAAVRQVADTRDLVDAIPWSSTTRGRRRAPYVPTT
jgi:hypothetical protein